MLNTVIIYCQSSPQFVINTITRFYLQSVIQRYLIRMLLLIKRHTLVPKQGGQYRQNLLLIRLVVIGRSRSSLSLRHTSYIASILYYYIYLSQRSSYIYRQLFPILYYSTLIVQIPRLSIIRNNLRYLSVVYKLRLSSLQSTRSFKSFG